MLLANDVLLQLIEGNLSRVVAVEGLHDAHGVLALERHSDAEAEGVELVDGDEAGVVLVLLAEDVVDAGLEVHGWWYFL